MIAVVIILSISLIVGIIGNIQYNRDMKKINELEAKLKRRYNNRVNIHYKNNKK